MLTFHILNVGHGISIVVEHEAYGGRWFGVIDSNASAHQEPKALTKLRQLGATRLSFVALTHPHKDHFSGLFSIISEFPTDCFFSCPFGDLVHNRQRLKSIADALTKIMNRSDGLDERLAALEMAQILKWANDATKAKTLDWYECKGEDFFLAPPGFSTVEISTVLPPSRVVSDYVQRISKGDMSTLGRFEDNDISLAFSFRYKGKCVILGGDGTAPNWDLRRRYEQRSAKHLEGNVVNLPHHGFKYDCTEGVLSQVFSNTGKRFRCHFR